MKILLTGATGFIGRDLAVALFCEGHDLLALTRDRARAVQDFPVPCDWIETNPQFELAGVDNVRLREVEAVVHLAGEPIAGGRWSESRKAEILRSRKDSTANLLRALKRSGASIKVIVGASAVGIYGDRGDENLAESAVQSAASGAVTPKSFLSEVCLAWEDALFGTEPSWTEPRRVALRIGVVLGRGGGVLGELEPIFRLGAGGAVGSGLQWMPWISKQDLIRAVQWSLATPNVTGVFNAAAPNPVRNRDFAQCMARSMGHWGAVPTPRFAIRAMFGDMADVVLGSQRVDSTALQEKGFNFLDPVLEPVLQKLYMPDPDQSWQNACDRFDAVQWVPAPIDATFDFFSDAKNLERITPPWLGFTIKDISTPEVRGGTLIDYALRLHGIPIHWRTRIEEWCARAHFVDTQLKGPYQTWHHRHEFESVRGGTLLTDRVLYQLPLGKLGRLAAGWKVLSDVRTIFSYRRKVIREVYGSAHEKKI